MDQGGGCWLGIMVMIRGHDGQKQRLLYSHDSIILPTWKEGSAMNSHGGHKIDIQGSGCRVREIHGIRCFAPLGMVRLSPSLILENATPL